MTKYYHDAGAVNNLVSKLRADVEEYNTKIADLNVLISEIESSSAWRHNGVKSSFVVTAKGYIDIYKTLVNKLNNYIEYLNKKSDAASQLEQAFS